jgi:hypothetical protein
MGKKLVFALELSKDERDMLMAVPGAFSGALDCGNVEPSVREALGDRYPRVMTEVVVRRIAGLLGESIPVQKYAGKQVESLDEAVSFVVSVLEQEFTPSWFARRLEAALAERPDGVYLIYGTLPARIDSVEKTLVLYNDSASIGYEGGIGVGENFDAVEILERIREVWGRRKHHD